MSISAQKSCTFANATSKLERKKICKSALHLRKKCLAHLQMRPAYFGMFGKNDPYISANKTCISADEKNTQSPPKNLPMSPTFLHKSPTYLQKGALRSCKRVL